MRKLLAAAALLAVSAGANAAVYNVTLTTHEIGRAANAPSLSDINPAPNAHPSFGGQDKGNFVVSFTYDDVTGTLSSSGTLHLRSVTNPVTIGGRVFDRFIEDLSITGGVASATSFLCENSPLSGTAAGGFGETVGANICGNYTLGGNFVDDSTLSYSGTTVTRVLAGDDVSAGDPQSLADYNLIVASFTGLGGQLILQSTNWLPQPQDPANSAGLQMTFSVDSVIPVPAAVWLFGSALGLLGLARRRLAS